MPLDHARRSLHNTKTRPSSTPFISRCMSQRHRGHFDHGSIIRSNSQSDTALFLSLPTFPLSRFPTATRFAIARSLLLGHDIVHLQCSQARNRRGPPRFDQPSLHHVNERNSHLHMFIREAKKSPPGRRRATKRGKSERENAQSPSVHPNRVCLSTHRRRGRLL